MAGEYDLIVIGAGPGGLALNRIRIVLERFKK